MFIIVRGLAWRRAHPSAPETGPSFVTDAATNIGAESRDEGVGSSAPAGQANGR
jgi:hypothetical protein